MTKRATSLEAFNELSTGEQFRLLHTDGVFIGKRKLGAQTVVLFQLAGFYVEVYYTAYRREVAAVVTTDNTDVLQLYIDQVQLPDLDSEEPPAK
ncbi:MAG: hypothetical protein JWP69_1466 [Flaviaesturariibacter sp.]|nr:hypothetical protein [Flaviaesturariibacter sp.]